MTQLKQELKQAKRLLAERWQESAAAQAAVEAAEREHQEAARKWQEACKAAAGASRAVYEAERAVRLLTPPTTKQLSILRALDDGGVIERRYSFTRYTTARYELLRADGARIPVTLATMDKMRDAKWVLPLPGEKTEVSRVTLYDITDEGRKWL